MSFDRTQFARIAKRLVEATGYLELGMPEHALGRLEGLGDLGPMAAEVDLLRGEALRCQHRFEDAAHSFQQAARKFPSPQKRAAWLALSRCYRQAGDTDRAIQSLANARGALTGQFKHKPL